MTRPRADGAARTALAAVLGAAVIVFGAAVWNGFVWDDEAFIRDNEAVQSLRNIPLFFRSGDAVGTGQYNPYYRPLTTTSFAVDYALWGDRPAGFHATNVVLHGAVCVLLLLLLRRFTAHPAAGLAAALLFAVHPAHAETVGYVSARADLLCGVFMLGAFLLHLRWTETGSRRDCALALVAYVLALLSKIVAIMLPALLVAHLLLFVPRERRKASPVLLYLLASLAFLAIRSRVLTMESWGPTPLPVRLANAAPFLMTYVGHALLPVDLKIFYDASLKTSFLEPVVIGAWLALAGIVWAVAASARRRPGFAFGCAWFFAALLPVSGIVMLLQPAFIADRYLYLPMAGASVAVGAVLDRVVGSPRFPRHAAWAAAAVAACVLACSVATARRLTLWRDSVTLWTAMDAGAPNNPFVLNGLGWSYVEERRFQEAEDVLSRAIALRDDSVKPHLNLAAMDLQRGALDDAERHVGRALELEPRNKVALTLQGVIQARQGDLEGAKAYFAEALRVDPSYRYAAANMRTLMRRIPRGAD